LVLASSFFLINFPEVPAVFELALTAPEASSSCRSVLSLSGANLIETSAAVRRKRSSQVRAILADDAQNLLMGHAADALANAGTRRPVA
jgi:hypothetical protein